MSPSGWPSPPAVGTALSNSPKTSLRHPLLSTHHSSRGAFPAVHLIGPCSPVKLLTVPHKNFPQVRCKFSFPNPTASHLSASSAFLILHALKSLPWASMTTQFPNTFPLIYLSPLYGLTPFPSYTFSLSNGKLLPSSAHLYFCCPANTCS